MNNKLIEFNKAKQDKKLPDVKSGDVVKVRRRFVEGGKETVQMFEGIVIAVKGKQSSSPTITVRKVSHGVGVELVLPVFSPLVKSIELVKRAKVRRSKLYFIREKSAKSLKMKYKELSSLIAKDEEEKPENKEEAAKE